MNASTLSKLDTFSPKEKQNLLDSMKTVKENHPVQAESVADSHTTFETIGKSIIDLDDSFVNDGKVASGVVQDEDIHIFDERSNQDRDDEEPGETPILSPSEDPVVFWKNEWQTIITRNVKVSQLQAIQQEVGVEVPNLETTSVVAFYSSYPFYDLFEKLLLLQIDKPTTYLYNLSDGMHPENKLGARMQ